MEEKFKKESEDIFAHFQNKSLEEIDKEPKADFKKAVAKAASVLKSNKLTV